MALRTVYRIENREGSGPFWAGHIKDAHREAYGENAYLHNPYDMPCPFDIQSGDVKELHEAKVTHGDPIERRNYVYAFPRKGTLRRWFKPALLRRLGTRGYTINVYRVRVTANTYAEGGDQVCFDRRAAVLVRREALA